MKSRTLIKVLCIFSFIFMLSGCTVDYNINIAKDGTISEDINLLTDLTKLKNNEDKEYYKVGSQTIYSNWLSNLDDYGMNIDRFNIYNIQYLDDSNKRAMVVKGTYDGLIDYKNSTNIYLFSNIDKVKETSSKLIFDVTIDNESLAADYMPQQPDKININITSPLDVIETNTKIIDKNTNTYTWTITPSSPDTNIKIVFDKNTGSIFANKNKNIIGIIIITILLGVSIVVILKYKRYNNLQK